MVKYFQLWPWDGDKDEFVTTSSEIGRTQVETFNRMIRVFRESDEYKQLVKLNKTKKHKTLTAFALLLLAMLSFLSMGTSRVDLSTFLDTQTLQKTLSE